MKYNPDYHSTVVSNLRRMFQAKYGEECRAPDDRVWAVHDENAFIGGNADEATLEDLKAEQ